MPRSRFLAVVCLATLVASSVARTAEPERPTRLILSPGLLARLQTLAAGLHAEIVLCLTGLVDGATATATGFVMPDPYRSDSDRASFGTCPALSVAIWHNHPLSAAVGAMTANEPGYGRPRGDPNASPRDLCALSETDIRTAAREAHPFVVISVDGATWCWWSRHQVRKFAVGHALRGDPIPGQIVTRAEPYQTP